MDMITAQVKERQVAPFTGAWIEIPAAADRSGICESLPSRERGLKSPGPWAQVPFRLVAPFTGAWIEIHFWLASARK